MDGVGTYHIFLLTHRPQLQSSGVPKIFWEALYNKLTSKIFDGSRVFELDKIDYGDNRRDPKDPVWKVFVCAENGIRMDDPNNIYLVDHAWTYDTLHARKNLTENVMGILNRMHLLMGCDIETGVDDIIEYILKEMWRYNQAFSLSNGTIEDRMPFWYIMDELGSAINHSDNPNFRTVPFLHLTEGITYTLLFPIKDVQYREEVTRNFVEGHTSNVEKRQALLLPWVDNTFIDKSFEQEEPGEEYFLSGRIPESLPDEINEDVFIRGPNDTLKVYSDYSYIGNFLTDPAFELVDIEDRADILWFTTHFKQYRELSHSRPYIYINQFPCENILTVKDLLCIVCRRKAVDRSFDPETLETYPEWLPTTYNLNTELVQFVAYFEQREAKGLDNVWICKPWNLARGLDTHITNNLFHILRLPSTGPKIAQRYITKPVLYDRPEIGLVKFDIRYVVLLKSVIPLKAYVYKNFFLRFANKEFALNNFDDYEQHFTVMNYNDDALLCHLKCADFIVEWEKQYPNYPWKTSIESKIMNMFKEVFEAAVEAQPPKGLAHSPQSRALYAADLILEWKGDKIQPVLLEFNFSPDCQRACDYYPDFYNDIFKCLFLDMVDPNVLHDLFSDFGRQ